MVTAAFRVLAPGLQTSVQDFPGRVGHWRTGVPPSGPMDSLSFRLANRLVGNAPGAPALEIQLLGPTLEALGDADIAILGGEPAATVDGSVVPIGRSLRLRAGSRLSFGAVKRGARSYLAVAGGFDRPLLLGSAATFVRGGIGGRGLMAGDTLLRAGSGDCGAHLMIAPDAVPPIEAPAVIQATAGAHFDWLDRKGRAALVEGPWKVTTRSDRTGIRLDGPPLSYARRALEKSPEHGADPSNVINTGYSIGGVNICGGTPIILPFDGPSQGGFITPLVVASAAMWKLGQLRPGDRLIFRRIGLEEAIERRREVERLAESAKLLPVRTLVMGGRS